MFLVCQICVLNLKRDHRGISLASGGVAEGGMPRFRSKTVNQLCSTNFAKMFLIFECSHKIEFARTNFYSFLRFLHCQSSIVLSLQLSTLWAPCVSTGQFKLNLYLLYSEDITQKLLVVPSHPLMLFRAMFALVLKQYIAISEYYDLKNQPEATTVLIILRNGTGVTPMTWTYTDIFQTPT